MAPYHPAAAVLAAGGSSTSPNSISAGRARARPGRLAPDAHAAAPKTAYFTLAPDWVCEVLSPSTASLDRVKKLAIYAREQVGHAWLVDPVARTLEVLRLEAGRWTILATHAGDEVVRAEPFADIDLELALLWADEEGESGTSLVIWPRPRRAHRWRSLTRLSSIGPQSGLSRNPESRQSALLREQLNHRDFDVRLADRKMENEVSGPPFLADPGGVLPRAHPNSEASWRNCAYFTLSPYPSSRSPIGQASTCTIEPLRLRVVGQPACSRALNSCGRLRAAVDRTAVAASSTRPCRQPLQRALVEVPAGGRADVEQQVAALADRVDQQIESCFGLFQVVSSR